MTDKKLFGRSCPVCNETYQSCELAKVHLGAGVHANMECPNGHRWTEFYTLNYEGYWFNGKRYDSFGEEKENKVI
jgi:hypothetical protein